jgi:hypothetical protein
MALSTAQSEAQAMMRGIRSFAATAVAAANVLLFPVLAGPQIKL